MSLQDCDSVLAELDAWLDGEVPPSERARIELHLATCEECRTIADDARAIHVRGHGRSPLAAALPQLEPPRDYWPAIRDRIGEAPRRSARQPQWRALAAAAVVLIGLSAAITAAALWPTGSAPEAVAPGAPEAGLAATSGDPTGDPDPGALGTARGTEVAAEVRASAAELAQVVDQRRSQLDPDTVVIVEQNLAIIDQAITEIEAALARDPADGRAKEALVGAYNQKVRLLQAVLHTPSGG